MKRTDQGGLEGHARPAFHERLEALGAALLVAEVPAGVDGAPDQRRRAAAGQDRRQQAPQARHEAAGGRRTGHVQRRKRLLGQSPDGLGFRRQRCGCFGTGGLDGITR